MTVVAAILIGWIALNIAFVVAMTLRARQRERAEPIGAMGTNEHRAPSSAAAASLNETKG